MKTSIKISVILTLATSVFGCSSDFNNADANNSNANNNSHLATEQSKVKAGPIGKPSPAPISMQYKVLNSGAQPGETINLELKFDSPVKSAIQTKMTMAENLTVINKSNQWTSQMSKSGEREPLPQLQVVAPANGIYYIRFVASIEKEGKTLSKPFIVPLNVGNVAVELEPVGEVITDDKGQKVLIQKASTD
jgi:hypothetical protein